MWVAVGSGTNTIAHSTDGISWTGLGTSIFSTSGNSVEWNGELWVAVGEGTNTIAYSTDGINWTNSSNGNTIFTTKVKGVSWNGNMWVATGNGTNSIAYSYDAITWTAAGPTGNSLFHQTNGIVNDVGWNGEKWIAVGKGANERNFTQRTGIVGSTPSTTPQWWSVVSSADGTKLVACVGQQGNIYTSTDSGATWSAIDSSGFDGTQNWFCLLYTSDAADE